MRLAALQMRTLAGDQEANLERVATAAREAAAAGADLLAVPELALPGYGAGEAMRRLAVAPGDELPRRLDRLAGETGIAIVAGLAEREGPDVCNSAFLFTGDNTPFIYRKSHLYGSYERGHFRPGEPSAGLVEIAGMKVGFLICYDVEFPENVRRLAQAGAEAVIVPTALPVGPYARFIARQVVPVRAFENQVFVAYVNNCGSDPLFSYAGLSVVAAPDGSLLAEAGEEGEELLLADLDPARYASSARQNAYLADLVP